MTKALESMGQPAPPIALLVLGRPVRSSLPSLPLRHLEERQVLHPPPRRADRCLQRQFALLLLQVGHQRRAEPFRVRLRLQLDRAERLGLNRRIVVRFRASI